MEVKILGKEENTIFGRTEIKFSVSGERITPARKALREKIAAICSAKPELVIIEKISQQFGSSNVKGTARIYKDRAAMERLEEKYMLGRNIGEKRRGKKAEKGAEAEAEKGKGKEKAAEAKEAEKGEAKKPEAKKAEKPKAPEAKEEAGGKEKEEPKNPEAKKEAGAKEEKEGAKKPQSQKESAEKEKKQVEH